MPEMGGLPVPGLKELETAANAWAEDGDKKEKAEKIITAITTAADAPHDLFNGLRIFAGSLRKAVDGDDEKALDKALGMKDKFLKALNRFPKKVEALQAQMKAQAEAMEKAKAEAEAKKAAEGDAGGSSDDDDDDPDFDADDSADTLDDDEF